jgi:hypothetical protein
MAAMVPSLRHGELVVRVEEEGIWIRQKGRRKLFLLPHGRAFQLAVQLDVARQRDARKGSRKKR